MTYSWDFGDGSVAHFGLTQLHTYAAVGSYTVTVTATNAINSISAIVQVRVVDIDIAGLAADNSSPASPIPPVWPDALPALVDAPVFFTGTITAGSNVTYSWDFGDGAMQSGATASHHYAIPGNYTATVTAINGTGSTSATTAVTIWPTPTLQFASAAYVVDEDAGVATAIVTLNAEHAQTITVFYAASAGSALAPEDFALTSGMLTFAPGSAVQTFTVPIIDDGLDEPLETVTLVLSNAVGAELGTPEAATLSIIDNDLPPTAAPTATPQPTAEPTAQPTVPQTPITSRGRVYLPLLIRLNGDDHLSLRSPDLVVKSINAESRDVIIVVTNMGDAPVTNAFWVDLYVDPSPAPTKVNDVWTDGRSRQGVVWGVTSAALPLQSGASLTLSLSSPYLRTDATTLRQVASGAVLVVQVDSASTLDPLHGAVKESHELRGTAYNNIATTRTTVALDATEAVDAAASTARADTTDAPPAR